MKRISTLILFGCLLTTASWGTNSYTVHPTPSTQKTYSQPVYYSVQQQSLERSATGGRNYQKIRQLEHWLLEHASSDLITFFFGYDLQKRLDEAEAKALREAEKQRNKNRDKQTYQLPTIPMQDVNDNFNVNSTVAVPMANAITSVSTSSEQIYVQSDEKTVSVGGATAALAHQFPASWSRHLRTDQNVGVSIHTIGGYHSTIVKNGIGDRDEDPEPFPDPVGELPIIFLFALAFAYSKQK